VRHAFVGNFQAAGVNLVGRNADRFSIGADLIFDVLGRQPTGEGLGVGGFHAGHERLVVRSDDQVSEENHHARQAAQLRPTAE
jgi:hypothetical protein